MVRKKQNKYKPMSTSKACHLPNIFEKLPPDIIPQICQFLDDKSLFIFIKFICPPIVVEHRALHALVNKRTSTIKLHWKSNDFSGFLPLDRFVAANKWSSDSHKKSLRPFKVFKERSLMPRLCLQEDCLWYSHGSTIMKHQLDRNGSIESSSRPNAVLHHHQKAEDITKFSINDWCAVAGLSDGHITIWENDSDQWLKYRAHKQDTHAVDSNGNILVSGSRDKTIAAWQICPGDNGIHINQIMSVNMHDRVWSIKLDESLRFVAVGIAACTNIMSPITLWDMQTARTTPIVSMHHEFKRGAGITDMLFQDANSLLTCSYDTTVRLWDIRCGLNASTFVDPYDTSLFSLASDHNNTIMVGASRYSRVWIIDKRNMTQAVKRFQFNASSRPVYSVAFNTKNIFVALDNSVTVFNI